MRSKLIELCRSVYSAAFWIFVFLSSMVIYVFSSCVTFFMKSEEKKKIFFQKKAAFWGKIVLGVLFIKVKISGLENIPAGTNVIYTPNHQSYLDIFILLKYLPSPFKFVVMRKLFKVPFIGYHITKAGFISLDRKDRKRSIKTIHRVIDLLEAGRSFVIFPEGKLTLTGKINDFGRGAGMIVQRAGKPVVPIAIDGTFLVLPKGAWKLNLPAEVKVTIGKPVYFNRHSSDVTRESSADVARELRDMVVKLKG